MERIKEFFEEHRGIVIGLIAAGCILIALAVTAGTLLTTSRGDEGVVRQELVEDDEPDRRTSQHEEEEEEDPKPTSQQAALIEAYDTDEEDIVEMLSGYTWHGIDGRGLATFTDNVITESRYVDGEAVTEKHAYAITNVESNGILAEAMATVQERDAVIVYDDGTYSILRCTRTPGDGGVAEAIEISSASFAQETYTNAYSALEVSIEGIESEELADAVDGKSDELELAIVEYLSLNYGWVSSVAWTGSYTVDVNEGTARIPFTVKNLKNQFAADSSADGTMTVVYSWDDGTFTMEVS